MSLPLYSILTFLVVLGPLVLLHELGHLVAAKLAGVKVVEFGFGFPPRAAGIWTGRTRVRLSPGLAASLLGRGDDLRARALRPDEAAGQSLLKVGGMIAFSTTRGPDGGLIAHDIHEYRQRSREDGVSGLVAGKIRDIDGDAVLVSEMVWSFNWLPLGGFVKMIGEEDPAAEGSLASKSRWARTFVLVAGAGVNAVIPFVLFTILAMVPQDKVVGEVTIASVMPGSPAERAGLRQGDIVVRVDGREIRNISDLQEAVTLRLGAVSHWDVRKAIPDPHPVPGATRFQYQPELETVEVVPRWQPPSRQVVRGVTDPASQIELWRARMADPFVGLSNRLKVVERATDTLHEISLRDAQRLDPSVRPGDELQVVAEVTDPRTQISLEDARRHDPALGIATRMQEGAVGVTIGANARRTERGWSPPWTAVVDGAHRVADLLVLTRNGVTGILIKSSNPQLEGPATVGPIGISQLTGEIATSSASWEAKATTLASLAAALSMSLAIINILPIPALDGGRLLFVVIEAARGGKRISPEREGLVHLAGMVVLLSLMVLISAQDLLRIIRGESFF